MGPSVDLHKPERRFGLAALGLALAAALTMGPVAAQSLVGPERLVSAGGRSGAVAVDGRGNFIVVWSAPGADGDGTEDVYAQRFSSAGPALGPSFLVNTVTAGPQAAPAVAADQAGDFVIVWVGGSRNDPRSGDGQGSGIFGQLFGPDGERRGGPIRVNNVVVGNQILPAVAMDRAGDFVVGWVGGDSIFTAANIVARLFSAAGVAARPQFQVSGDGDGPVFAPPAVAMGPGGGFAVGWTATLEFHGSECPQLQCTDFFPRLRAYAPNGAFRGRLQLDAGGSTVLQVLLASPAGGDYLALWVDGAAKLRGRRVAVSGQPSGPAFSLPSCRGADCPDFQAAAEDAQGHLVVVFSQGQALFGPTTLLGRLYRSSGAPLGPLFDLTSLPDTRPSAAAVAFAETGSFEVVWERASDGTHRAGLFRRLLRR